MINVPPASDHAEVDLGTAAGVTDRGLRHSRNEDAMAFATAETAAGPVAVAVVCDGVSTSPRSDEASLAGTQAAVRMLLTSMRRGDDPAEASLAAVEVDLAFFEPGELPRVVLVVNRRVAAGQDRRRFELGVVADRHAGDPLRLGEHVGLLVGVVAGV